MNNHRPTTTVNNPHNSSNTSNTAGTISSRHHNIREGTRRSSRLDLEHRRLNRLDMDSLLHNLRMGSRCSKRPHSKHRLIQTLGLVLPRRRLVGTIR